MYLCRGDCRNGSFRYMDCKLGMKLMEESNDVQGCSKGYSTYW